MLLIPNEKNVPRAHLIGTLLIVLLITLGLSAFFSWQQLAEGRAIQARAEQAADAQIRAHLTSEMESAVSFLEYTRSQTEAVLRRSLVEQVDSAYQIMAGIHARESGQRPAAEVRRLIVEALRPVRFYDGRGYYFIDDMQGQFILLPTAPQLEGQTKLDNRDDTGHYITRGLVEAALRSDEGGFSAYRWYPPDNRQEMSDKLAYTRLFKPYGWVIGTGDYLDQWHTARLKEGIERLRAWRFGGTGRFEVLGLDGTLLLQHASGGDEGKDYRQLGSPEEQAIRGRMIALARQGGGLLEYPWRQPGSDVVDTRSALVQRFASWNIVLVATLSSREIQATIDAEKASAWASLSSRLPYAGLVAVLAILGAILASALFSRWMIGLLQGYKRDLDAHALALEQKAGELHLAGHVFESSKEGILITDAERRILAVNPAFTAISGYRAEEVVGKQPDLLASGKHEPDFYRSMWQTIRETGSWSGEIWNQRRDGSIFPELLQITTVRSASGEVLHYVGTFLDLTERKEAEDRIRQLAEFDPLTGLPNRSLLSDRLAQVMARAERENRLVATLVLDLDRFKTINDSLGHEVGDKVLRAVADRLRSHLRESDTVSRFGGDEFALLGGHLGYGATTPLTLGNISRLARHIWLSRQLRISLREFLELMAMTGISTPAFWLGLGVIVLFYGHLQILPGGGRLDDWLDPPTHVTGFYLLDALLEGNGEVFFNALQHLILPSLTLAFVHLGIVARQVRSAMLEQLSEDYIRTARAYGLSRWAVILRHAAIASSTR